MLDYRTRLISALDGHGASRETMRTALASLDGEYDEDRLLREFGEPEDYAAQFDFREGSGSESHKPALIVCIGLAALVIMTGIARQAGYLSGIPDWPMFTFLVIALLILLAMVPFAFVSSMVQARRIREELRE